MCDRGHCSTKQLRVLLDERILLQYVLREHLWTISGDACGTYSNAILKRA